MQTSGSFTQRLLWVVWPAFLVAGVAEGIFFTIFDPFELHFFGAPLEMSRMAIYTMGFFGFWGLGIAASALTVFLERSPLDARRNAEAAPGGPVDDPDRDESRAADKHSSQQR